MCGKVICSDYNVNNKDPLWLTDRRNIAVCWKGMPVYSGGNNAVPSSLASLAVRFG